MRVTSAALGTAAVMAANAGHASIRLDLMHSTDNGATWQQSGVIEAIPGNVVQMAIFASGDLGYGFAAATLRLSGTNMVAGDRLTFGAGTSTGRVGPFNFGAATNAIYQDSATDFRIDAASDPTNTNENAGLTFFQRDPATAAPGTFSTANPAMVFRFDYWLGAFDRNLVTEMRLDQLSHGLATRYDSSSSSRGTSTSDVILGGPVIIMIPAPASVMIGLAGVAAIGRRRR